MRKMTENKKYRSIIWLLLTLLFIPGFPSQVYGAAQASFGSESYSPQIGQDFPMGIYIIADETFTSGETEVRYDPEILEYISGGELTEEGLVHLSYVNIQGNEGRQDIQFRPKAGGKTEVYIESAQAFGAEGSLLEMTDMQRVPVNIPIPESCRLSGAKLNGVDMNFTDDSQTELYGEVPGTTEEAEIQAIPAQEGATVTVESKKLEEGENLIKISVADAAGNQAIYNARILRQAMPEALSDENEIDSDEEELGQDMTVEEQTDTEDIHEISFPRERLLIVGGIFLLLEIIICVTLIIRIRSRRKKRRRGRQREKQRNQEERRKRKEESLKEEKRKVEEKEIATAVQKIIEEKQQGESGEEENYEIQVKDVTMTFRIIQNAPSSVKEYVIKKIKKETKYREFSALKHISFNVKKGEVVGIIGTNGSGKSTILKIISGALAPTSGEVKVDRRKIQLLTLGTGFDFELTGRENVYLNGAIIGYTKEYIDEKYEDIVKFAELEGFMDEKVKNYSSGMVSRLGFAIATMRDTPEILILDEVLSVGDMFFRKKSEARIKEMIHGGSTVLIVSHSMDVIRKNCDKVVWIEKGDLKMIGKPEEVCPAYAKLNG